jgi:hypothetical protein
MNIFNYIKKSFKSAKKLIINDYNNSYLEKIVFSWGVVNKETKQRKYIRFPLLVLGLSIIYFLLTWASKNINSLVNNKITKNFENLNIRGKDFFGFSIKFLDLTDNITIILMTFSTCYLFLFGVKAFLPALTNFIRINNKLLSFFVNLLFPILVFTPIPYLNTSIGAWVLEFMFTFCIDCFLEGGIHKFGIEHLHIWITISSSFYFISMVFVSLIRLSISLDTASYIANEGYILNGKNKEKIEIKIEEYAHSKMEKISAHLSSKINTMVEFTDLFKILKSQHNKGLDDNKEQEFISNIDIKNQNFENFDNQKINMKSIKKSENSKRKRRAKNKRSRKARRKHKK